MRKLIRSIKADIKEFYAPYCVVASSGKKYPCWTWAEVLKWVKACNSRVMGDVYIYGWTSLIAIQYQTKEIK